MMPPKQIKRSKTNSQLLPKSVYLNKGELKEQINKNNGCEIRQNNEKCDGKQ